MSNKIHDCCDGYDYASEGGQHPISTHDADILLQIKKAIRLIGDKTLSSILKGYKEGKEDMVIYDDLMEWIAQKEVDVEQNEDEEITKDFISINDEDIIQVSLISTLSKASEYDYDLEKNVYKIIINKHTGDGMPRYALTDKVYEFYSKESRDSEWEKVKSRLSEFTKIRFL